MRLLPSLCFGNAGYMYLTVSFVQMLKAFTPCVVSRCLRDRGRLAVAESLVVLGMSRGPL